MAGFVSPQSKRMFPLVSRNAWQVRPVSQSSSFVQASQALFLLLPQPASGRARSSNISIHRVERIRTPNYDTVPAVSTRWQFVFTIGA